MGFFDTLGSKIKSGLNFLGQKATDFGNWIGKKIPQAIPIIKTIADTVNYVAEPIATVADFFAPKIVGDGIRMIGKGGKYVSENLGKATNTLEKVRDTSLTVGNNIRKFN